MNVLNSLKSLGYKLALITDGYQVSQELKIKALGIKKWFDLIICTDKFGRNHWKPSDLSYRLVEKHFNVTGENCIYIGDNPRKDFIIPNTRKWGSFQYKNKKQVHTFPLGLTKLHYAQQEEITNLNQLSKIN